MQRHPGTTATRLLMASVFIVMGGYRLWGASQGVPASGSTLTFSAIELVLGLSIAWGWKLRVTAILAAVLMLVDAALSHPFWALAGQARDAQLLHFMKNIGFAGGLLLLSITADSHRRRR